MRTHGQSAIGLSAFALIASMTLATPAAAATYAGGITRDEMATLLKSEGYDVRLETDDNGLKIIKTSAVGVNFDVYLLDCDKTERCTSLQFAAGWSLTTAPTSATLNKWNREKRFVRAYLTADDKALYGELDIDLHPAGSSAQIEEHLRLWKVILPQLKTHFSF